MREQPPAHFEPPAESIAEGTSFVGHVIDALDDVDHHQKEQYRQGELSNRIADLRPLLASILDAIDELHIGISGTA